MFGGIETPVMEQNVRLNRWWKGNTSNRKLWAEAQTVLWIHAVAELITGLYAKKTVIGSLPIVTPSAWISKLLSGTFSSTRARFM